MKTAHTKLTKNWKQNECKIKSIHFPGRSGGDRIEYTYNVNDKNYDGQYSIGSLQNKSKYLSTKGKTWTIIFDTTDFENSALLLKLEDYKKFNVPYSGQEILDVE